MITPFVDGSRSQAALKKELGNFMKGLDFASFAQQTTAAEDEDEADDDDEDDEEDDDDEADEEDDEDEQEDEDEEEDDDEEVEAEAPATASKATKKDTTPSEAPAATPASRIDDPSPESATVSRSASFWSSSSHPLTHCRRCLDRGTGRTSSLLSHPSQLLLSPYHPSS